MNIQSGVIAGWILITAGCVLALPASPSWPAFIGAGALLVAAQFISLNTNDRLILRAFAGVPLVIAIASAYFWAGVVAQCGILMLVISREGLAPETRGPVLVFAVAGSVLVIGAIIDLSNHMRIPFLVISTGILACAGILWVRLYRLKRTYRSPVP
jgi:hypothetical protein